MADEPDKKEWRQLRFYREKEGIEDNPCVCQLIYVISCFFVSLQGRKHGCPLQGGPVENCQDDKSDKEKGKQQYKSVYFLSS